jgi:aminopeptidase N
MRQIGRILNTYLFLVLIAANSYSNSKSYSIDESLQNVDVSHYHILVRFELENKSIVGFNEITFSLINKNIPIVFDLHENLRVDSILWLGKPIKYSRKKSKIWVSLSNEQMKTKHEKLKIYYHGLPIIAKKAPWDGGLVYTKDKLGNDWLGMACEGIGAGCWIPCKNQLSDKVDSVLCQYEVKKGYNCIGNGQLINIKSIDSKTNRFSWKTSYPIADYNITFNIGKYVTFSEKLVEADGDSLALDYYVMPYNLNAAKKHFKQTQQILSVYEKYFGKYPFKRDGFALVETSYWGMEHQGAVSYGNEFRTDYLVDFIILHETAHEWWGNHLAADHMSEMWIQEGYATYSEWLFYEEVFGKDTAMKYALRQRNNIANQRPILQEKNDPYRSLDNTDLYYKGAWILHTLRNWVQNDSLWFGSVAALQKKYGQKCINSDSICSFYEKYFGMSLKNELMYYLKSKDIPCFQYRLKELDKENILVEYKWLLSSNQPFNMPIIIEAEHKRYRLDCKQGQGKLIVKASNKNAIHWPENNYLVKFLRDGQ